jgi:hypothetical protein
MERDTPPRSDGPVDGLAVDEAVDEVRPFVSPEEFYREAMQREDIRRILAALAK